MEQRLAQQIQVDSLSLNVADLPRMSDFYQRAIGLEVTSSAPGRLTLGAGGDAFLNLLATADGNPRPPGTTGLFHLAVLEPDRPALARSLRRLLDLGAPLGGASDHLVSEALYLNDPEGNGIEIYRDRPAEQWRWEAGEVTMATLPLDLADLLESAGEPEGERAAALGHVHLNVASLEASRQFYESVIGFTVTASTYPGALFVAASGYHHQVGMNVWSGAGLPAPPQGSLGLSELAISLPDGAELDALAERLRNASAQLEQLDGGLLTTDPSGIPLRFVERAAAA